jgi:hypothetical protein
MSEDASEEYHNLAKKSDKKSKKKSEKDRDEHEEIKRRLTSLGYMV